MTDFPLLDRTESSNSCRLVAASFGYVEPYLDISDYWVAMPVTLAHTADGGWTIDIGPYSFDRNDIKRLHAALHAFHNTTSHSTNPPDADMKTVNPAQLAPSPEVAADLDGRHLRHTS